MSNTTSYESIINNTFDTFQEEKEYVFVVSSNNKTNDVQVDNSHIINKSIETEDRPHALCFQINKETEMVEEVPDKLPFLPLDASTEIILDREYSNAVMLAQNLIDYRIDTYSEYQKTVHNGRSQNGLLTSLTRRKENIKRRITNKKDLLPGYGWSKINHIDDSSRNLLQKLEEQGILYKPYNITLSVKYLSPVLPYGDCLFLSIEKLLLYSDNHEKLRPLEIRQKAVEYIWKHYSTCANEEERNKIDKAIENLYFPDLKKGWGISTIQARRYIAAICDKDLLLAKTFDLQNKGYTWDQAAEIIYSQYANPIKNIETYCQYMMIGTNFHQTDSNGFSINKNTHFPISMNYSRNGLISIDNDSDNNRVSWGDDIILEALATIYHRDIFVVLVGGGKIFFLPHRPRTSKPTNVEPWFLLMRITGCDRGGDHYEPMLCQSLPVDRSSDLGSIGD